MYFSSTQSFIYLLALVTFFDTFYIPLAALGDVSFGELSVALNATILDMVFSFSLFWLCIIVPWFRLATHYR
jgi:hypothetical protein